MADHLSTHDLRWEADHRRTWTVFELSRLQSTELLGIWSLYTRPLQNVIFLAFFFLSIFVCLTVCLSVNRFEDVCLFVCLSMCRLVRDHKPSLRLLWQILNTLPHNITFWRTIIYIIKENIARKGDIACNKQFLLVSQCFLPYMTFIFHFKCTLNCRLQFVSIWTGLKFCRFSTLVL